jgi:hypothetical protein
MKHLLNFKLFESVNEFTPKKEDDITNFPAYKKMEEIFGNVDSEAPSWAGKIKNKMITVAGLGYSFSVSPKNIIFYGSFNVCNSHKNPDVFTNWDNILKFITSYAIGIKLSINSNILQPFYEGRKMLGVDAYLKLRENTKFYDFIVNNALSVNPSFKNEIDKIEIMMNENILDPLAIADTEAFKYVSNFYDVVITPFPYKAPSDLLSLISISLTPKGSLSFSNQMESYIEPSQKKYVEPLSSSGVSPYDYFISHYLMSRKRGFKKGDSYGQHHTIGAKDNKTLEKYTWDLFGAIFNIKNKDLLHYANRSSDPIDKMLVSAYTIFDEKIMNKSLSKSEIYSDVNIILKDYISDLFNNDLIKFGTLSNEILTKTDNEDLKKFIKSFKDSDPLVKAGYGLGRFTEFDDED